MGRPRAVPDRSIRGVGRDGLSHGGPSSRLAHQGRSIRLRPRSTFAAGPQTQRDSPALRSPKLGCDTIRKYGFGELHP